MSRMLSWVTSGHKVRLDFSDGDCLLLGAAGGEVEVAIRPPTLPRLLWIFMRPGLRTGESYTRGDWSITSGDLATFLRILLQPRLGTYARIYGWISDWRGPIFQIRQRLLTDWNWRNLPEHYNAGNELYARMLDPQKQYSCAFFSLAASDELDVAQRAKIDTTIGRLHLDRPSLSVLDIGCGWGALAAEIASMPGSHTVLGITLSKEQFEDAQTLRDSLTPDVQARLLYRLEDYQRLLARPAQRFDRIVSVGMFEHVGLGRHIHFFRSVRRALTPGGKGLIHSIVRPSPGATNEWVRRYVFPGSFLPSVAEIAHAAEKAGLIVDAIHIHPPSDYRKTIRAWRARLADSWTELRRSNPTKYDAVLERVWTFYLASVETIFTEDLMNYRIAQIEVRNVVPT